MRQTIISVVLPVAGDALDTLESGIETLRRSAHAGSGSFPVLDAVPGLHFLSILAFGPLAGVPGGHTPVTALFVLEANIDGRPGPFWACLEAAIGEPLRDLLRCCTCPNSGPRVLFQSVTKPFSRAPIAPLLERCSIFPAASHRGHRGLSRQRIWRHAALFGQIQALLPAVAAASGTNAATLHAQLRGQLVAKFPWLCTGWEEPIPAAAYAGDWLVLLVFLVFSFAVAALPWLLLGNLIPPHGSAAAAFLLAAACYATLPDIGDLLPLFARPVFPQLWWVLVLSLSAASVATALLDPWPVLGWLMLFFAGGVGSVSALIATLRRRERRAPVSADAVPDPDLVYALEAWEGSRKPGADHMGSVVMIQPGWFRAFLARFGMLAVNLFVRVTGKQGYLGSRPFNRSMRSIHFAHWSFVDGGTRQMFLSNFDGSWESYLDDFIAKEHDGLTIAWGNGVGFPAARYLALDGAARGRQFKAWARLSMSPTRLHYAAYPDLTVDQIVRQADVAKGLTASRLRPEAALRWARHL